MQIAGYDQNCKRKCKNSEWCSNEPIWRCERCRNECVRRGISKLTPEAASICAESNPAKWKMHDNGRGRHLDTQHYDFGVE